MKESMKTTNSMTILPIPSSQSTENAENAIGVEKSKS